MRIHENPWAGKPYHLPSIYKPMRQAFDVPGYVAGLFQRCIPRAEAWRWADGKGWTFRCSTLTCNKCNSYGFLNTRTCTYIYIYWLIVLCLWYIHRGSTFSEGAETQVLCVGFRTLNFTIRPQREKRGVVDSCLQPAGWPSHSDALD